MGGWVLEWSCNLTSSVRDCGVSEVNDHPTYMLGISYLLYVQPVAVREVSKKWLNKEPKTNTGPVCLRFVASVSGWSYR